MKENPSSSCQLQPPHHSPHLAFSNVNVILLHPLWNSSVSLGLAGKPTKELARPLKLASIIWPLATCQSASRWPTPFQPQGTEWSSCKEPFFLSGVHIYPKALFHPIRALPVLITFSTLPDPVQALPLSGFPQPPTPFQQLNSEFLPCRHSSVFSPLFQYLPYSVANIFRQQANSSSLLDCKHQLGRLVFPPQYLSLGCILKDSNLVGGVRPGNFFFL